MFLSPVCPRRAPIALSLVFALPPFAPRNMQSQCTVTADCMKQIPVANIVTFQFSIGADFFKTWGWNDGKVR